MSMALFFFFVVAFLLSIVLFSNPNAKTNFFQLLFKIQNFTNEVKPPIF